MGAKRKLNGIGPGTRPKTVTAIPLTKEDWDKVGALMDKIDCTQGYLFKIAMEQWLGRRKS